MLSLLALLAVPSFVAASPAGFPTGVECAPDLSIPISVSVPARQFPSNFSLTTFNISNAVNLPTQQVSGDFNIAAQFCQPAVQNDNRKDTLQILIHGLTYDRTYWSGLNANAENITRLEYSWVFYASNQGYPTLSIDRICNGASSKPDGLVDCQLEVQAATIVEIVKKAKAGSIGGRSFSRVILVGHSAGSVLLNIISKKYPTVVDSLVMTGYSTHNSDVNANGGAALGTLYGPAAQAYPARFGSLSPDYLTNINEAYFEGLFYYGAYSHNVAEYDYNHTGTVTTGELATIDEGRFTVPEYKGNVIVITGQNDLVFCPQASGMGDCGTGSSSYTNQIKSLYPSSKSFLAFQTPYTGHCLNTHYTALLTFKVAHDFLAQQGY